MWIADLLARPTHAPPIIDLINKLIDMAEQETNQGANRECLMTTNDRVPIVCDGSSRNSSNHPTFSEALIRISEALDSDQLKVYILAISALGVQLQSVEKLKDFKAVFKKLETAMPTKSVSMTIETLDSLGVDTSALQPYVKDKFARQDHYNTDFVLTMGKILGNMSEKNYDNFLEVICRDFINGLYRDCDRADFLKQLFQSGDIELNHLYMYSDAIRIAGCKRLLSMLTDFQIRQETRKGEFTFYLAKSLSLSLVNCVFVQTLN